MSSKRNHREWLTSHGKRLKAWIMEQPVSSAEMAAKLGITQHRLTRLASRGLIPSIPLATRGKRPPIRAYVPSKVAAALGLS